MSYTKNELERIENMLPEHFEVGGRLLDRELYLYEERQNLLRGLLNKALDTSIDTNQKLYGSN